MKLQIELDEADLRRLVLAHLENVLCVKLNPEDIQIQVKTKENYRADKWEKGAFRAYVDKQGPADV